MAFHGTAVFNGAAVGRIAGAPEKVFQPVHRQIQIEVIHVAAVDMNLPTSLGPIVGQFCSR